MSRETTLTEQAEALEWGPTIEQPKTVKEAIDYALAVFGSARTTASLGEVYALKMLAWAQAEEVERKAAIVRTLTAMTNDVVAAAATLSHRAGELFNGSPELLLFFNLARAISKVR